MKAFRARVSGSTKLLVHSGGGVSIGSGTTPPANGLKVTGIGGIRGAAKSDYSLTINASSEFNGITVTNPAGFASKEYYVI